MSTAYLNSKIAEALTESGGQPDIAIGLVTAWANQDDKLLKALATPFLTSLAKQHVKSTIKALKSKQQAVAKKRAALAAGDFDSVIDAMHENFGPAPVNTDLVPARRGKMAASKRHVDALRTLSRAMLNRRFDALESSSGRG